MKKFVREYWAIKFTSTNTYLYTGPGATFMRNQAYPFDTYRAAANRLLVLTQPDARIVHVTVRKKLRSEPELLGWINQYPTSSACRSGLHETRATADAVAAGDRIGCLPVYRIKSLENP